MSAGAHRESRMKRLLSKLRLESPTGLDEELADKNARLLVPWCFVMVVLYLLWSTADFEHFPAFARRFLKYRIAACVAAVCLAGLALRVRSPTWKLLAVWCWFLVWGLATAAMIPDTPEYVLSHAIVIFMLQWASSSFILWKWPWGLTNALALAIAGEIAMLGIEGGVYEAEAHGYLFTGVVVNVTLATTRFNGAKREYEALRELENQKGLADALRQADRLRAIELEQALERAREVDRLKNEFFANISHELRTPLTLILSPVDELLGRLQPSPERSALNVVRRNATRLLRMIDDLLDLARLEAGGLRLKVTRLDVPSIVRRAVDNARPAARAKGIDLSDGFEGDPVDTFGDPHRVEIILTNLVGNALKFTPSGGQIRVTCEQTTEGTTVSVADTGPGISREEQDRIFERFHQTETSERRKQGGVGIGLALARELAELHGGSLTVQSEPGQGSAFRLFLRVGKAHFDTEVIERRRVQSANHPGRRIEDKAEPRSNDMTLATVGRRGDRRHEERVLLDRGRVPRILVAEDEDDLRGFIVALLKEIYEVDVAKTGAEALTLIQGVRPDLVLTDIMMPEVSGLDLCRSIKGDPTLRHIPVILLTARGESEAALEGYEAGADDFVSKPFHTKVLLARIRAHLKMRGLSLQLADQARLASAGTLAAGLAHEVKNPLNAILSAALVLEKGGSGRVPSDKLMRLIVDGIRRIDDIISALDAHARPADGMDLAPCDVREGIESTLALLAHKMKHIVVHRDFQVTGTVFAPARAFNQILLNLVDNAARSGGKNVWVELSQLNGRVKVAVADDGPGVPLDMVSRIFDPFFTTRAEGEGTGLGLHLSRRIAHECGGELRYETRSGGGARFVMEVPAMEKAA